jgi:Carboxypeptidase regulatory-like domain
MFRRRSAVLVSMLFAVVLELNCGSSSPSAPTPTATPTPTPTPAPVVTYAITGIVKSSAGVALNGASVRVSDGPNAGQSTFTTSSGSYALSGLSLAGFTVIASEPGFVSVGQGVTLTAGVTTFPLNFTLAPAGPSTSFGNGQYTVGSSVAAGRYFTDPPNGCYWERESGFGGTLSEIIANDFVGFDARQWIVDILGSDKGFKSDGCGTWTMTPRIGPAAGSIQPGMWLVGSQIAPGTYHINAGPGCYWERLRDFRGELSSINANNFSSGGGPLVVTISAGDVGFDSDADCGTWSAAAASAGTLSERPQTAEEVAAMRAAARAKWPPALWRRP